MNSEDRNAISRFIHDLISWLKARLKGEKVSLKIVKLENRFAAVLRNVDNANAQKNNTTNDSDVQYEYGRKKLDRKNKTVYNEFNTIAMQWANSSNVEQGEVKRLFDNNSKKWCLIIADENSDGGYYVLGTGTYEEVRAEYDRYIEEDANAFSEDIEAYKSFQGKYNSSMREHSEQRNGRQYSLGNRESGPKFAGTANAQYVRTNNQEKSSEAGLDNSAFSMPENDDVEYSFEDDVVDKTSSLAERVRLGEISQTEYLNELQSLMNEATEKYGVIPKGENPTVDVTVPKQVSDKRNTRRFVRTVLESGILTDEMVADTDEAILKDALSYVPISNDEAIKVASKSLKNGTAERDWNKVANGDKIPSKHDIAKGEMLLKIKKDIDGTVNVFKLVYQFKRTFKIEQYGVDEKD